MSRKGWGVFIKCCRPLTKKIQKLGVIASREKSVSQFIPYTRHVDDTTLKTKEGYLLKILKVDGLPFETADQIDINQRKNVRATLLRGLSNSRFAIYHHIIRREVKDRTAGFLKMTGANLLIRPIKTNFQARKCS